MGNGSAAVTASSATAFLTCRTACPRPLPAALTRLPPNNRNSNRARRRSDTKRGGSAPRTTSPRAQQSESKSVERTEDSRQAPPQEAQAYERQDTEQPGAGVGQRLGAVPVERGETRPPDPARYPAQPPSPEPAPRPAPRAQRPPQGHARGRAALEPAGGIASARAPPGAGR